MYNTIHMKYVNTPTPHCLLFQEYIAFILQGNDKQGITQDMQVA